MGSGNHNALRKPLSQAIFRPDIQGLRAVAVLLVVIYHTNALGVTGGFIGVDVFFVISGYLITKHLLSSLENDDGIDIGEFYARRIRRILPVSFFVLLSTLVAMLAFAPPVSWPSAFADAVYAAVYLPNVWFAVQKTDYLSESHPSPFQHYWSLGVEEQFYLLWPVFLLVIWRLGRPSRARLGVVVFAVMATSFGFGWWLTHTAPVSAFFGPLSRVWELGVGALVAMLSPNLVRLLPVAVRQLLAWGGLFAILGTAMLYDSATAFPGWAASVPVVGAALVILTLQEPLRGGPSRLLGASPMMFVGKISYSLYLVHWPLLIVPAAAMGRPLGSAAAITLAIGSVPLAWALYRGIEDPIRLNRILAEHRPRYTASIAVALTVLTVVSIFGMASIVPRPPVDAGRPAADTQPLSAHRVDGPLFAGFVPSDIDPSLVDVAEDVPLFYSEGCFLSAREVMIPDCSYGDLEATTTVALFGDSHAAQWFPAVSWLGVRQGFRVEVYAKANCPSNDVEYVLNGLPYSECTEWRKSVVDRLVKNPPDMVILASRNAPPDQPRGGFSEEGWGRGLSNIIVRLHASDVVFLADTPRFTFSPRMCLGANLNNADRCQLPRQVALNASLAQVERSVAMSAGATVIDLNDYLCSEDVCGVIVGRTMLYRDDHHLTATASLALAPALWEQLRDVIVVEEAVQLQQK